MQNSSQKQYDVCIIGSGVTGSLVARHFVPKGAEVLMLERGNDVYFPTKRSEFWTEGWVLDHERPGVSKNYWQDAEKHFDDLVEIENIGPREWRFYYNMKYGLGGSGAVWSAASWRYLPEDFKTRSNFGYGRDWPFEYETLAPYYNEVEQLFHTSGPQDIEEWPWENNYRYPAFRQSYLDKVVADVLKPEFIVTPNAVSVKNLPPEEGGCIGAKTCVRKCVSNAKFRPDLHVLMEYRQAENFTLLMGSPCIRINLTPDKKSIKSISYLHKGRTVKEVTAKYYFLAANAIENMRLLMHSADSDNGPVANSSGLLGHYFSSHASYVRSMVMHEKLYVSRGRPSTSIALNTLRHKERAQVGAFIVEIWNNDWSIGTSPRNVLRNLRRRKGHWGSSLFEKAVESDQRFAMTMVFETEMRQRNQVSLSNYKDKYGLPLAKVNFEPSERDLRTFEHVKSLDSVLNQKPGIKAIHQHGHGLNGNHPLGGYVCGNDPANSVTDDFMRSHDHENLYILGGGAFNSTCAINPTHTIAALALKAVSDERLEF
ncbi:MAG: GMC family oxidoreductase [Pseudomonadota bacterium]